MSAMISISGDAPAFHDQKPYSDPFRLCLHFLRIIAGIIVFPYGMQKLFGWSSAPGIKGSLEQLTARKIPKFIAWLIIIGQSLGSIALTSGFFGRIAAGGLFIIFTGALIVHLPEG
jgi:putative oxidoreductase